MATAAIRLKFTSLIKNRSKCCLEIVPEISSMQNLDTIKWTQDADSIEYVVPITYKIILKKCNTLKENRNLINSYHSCVDLVRSSTFAYLDNARGDVKTIASDHLISTKSHLTSIDTDMKVSTPPTLTGEKTGRHYTHTKSTPNEIKNLLNDTFLKQNFGKIKDSPIRSAYFSDSFNTKKKLIGNKHLDTYSNNTVKHTISVSTIANIPLPLSNDVKNLTVSSVCKINTNDKLPTKDSTTNCLPIVSYKPNRLKQKYRRNLERKELTFSPPAWDLPFNQNIFKFSDTFFHKPYNIYQTSVRSHPKARVAHFKSAMEREILPLKIILRDLLTKCATLGFLNKTITNSSKDCAIESKPEEVTLTKYNGKPKLCNRVVYSFIFDE